MTVGDRNAGAPNPSHGPSAAAGECGPQRAGQGAPRPRPCRRTAGQGALRVDRGIGGQTPRRPTDATGGPPSRMGAAVADDQPRPERRRLTSRIEPPPAVHPLRSPAPGRPEPWRTTRAAWKPCTPCDRPPRVGIRGQSPSMRWPLIDLPHRRRRPRRCRNLTTSPSPSSLTIMPLFSRMIAAHMELWEDHARHRCVRVFFITLVDPGRSKNAIAPTLGLQVIPPGPALRPL